MAHAIWKKEMPQKCPRCGCPDARLATYHFGTTTTAECSGCALGNVSADSEEMAMARLNGKYYEFSAPTH
jgi:hypothetical protein